MGDGEIITMTIKSLDPKDRPREKLLAREVCQTKSIIKLKKGK
jgi:hypothetical protein